MSDKMREALRKAVQLAAVASDWNLNEVEVDGQMIRTRLLEAEFEEALAQAEQRGDTPEDRAEQFIRAAIDRAPEPLRRLGEYLTRVLDEDEWPTAESLLLGIATSTPAPVVPEGWKLVPVRMPDRMVAIMQAAKHDGWDLHGMWESLLAAAPAPEAKP